MAKSFNWGIIGLGHIAKKFAEDLKVIENAKLHAVASRSMERAKKFATDFTVAHHFDSYEGILSCPGLDAVYIATPHTSHCEIALMCLKKGIPVLCEKPFAMNASELKSMIEMATQTNTFLMEGLWTRFLPSLNKALNIIRSGALGTLNLLEADFGFKAPFDPDRRLFNPNLGGGALMDVGIYPVFLSLLVLGYPKTIKALATFGKTNVDETCGMMFGYENQKMAILHASITTNTTTKACFHGSKGRLRINSRWHEPTSLTLMLDGEEPKDIFFEFDCLGYRYEAEELMRCVQKGKKESQFLPLGFSLKLMELMDAVRAEAGIFYTNHDYPVGGKVLDKDKKFSWN